MCLVPLGFLGVRWRGVDVVFWLQYPIVFCCNLYVLSRVAHMRCE